MNPKKLLKYISFVQATIIIVSLFNPNIFLKNILDFFSDQALEILYILYYFILILSSCFTIMIFYTSKLGNVASRKMLLIISIYSIIMLLSIIYINCTTSIMIPTLIYFVLACFIGYTINFYRKTRFDFLDE